MPKLSVILPVYNMENYLADTLKSIQNQTFSDFELICIDDGSKDNSLAFLKKASEQDPRVTVLSQENLGPGQARNVGLEHANGEYVIMLDSDDIYLSTMFEKMLNKAEKTNADVIVCRSSEFDSTTSTIADTWWTINISQIPNKSVFSVKDMPDFIFTAFIGWPWDKLYRRSFIEQEKLRFPILSNSEDLYFVFLSLAKAKRISVVEEVLVNHRVNRAGSVSASRAKAPLQFYESTCLLKKELKKDLSLYSLVSWGFLNWAFTYMLWNIETMDDLVGRAVQLKSLREGRFAELEIALHSPAFFSLEPSGYGRYLTLLREAENIPEVYKVKRPILKLLIRVLSKWQRDGLCNSITLAINVVLRKLFHVAPKPVQPKLVRGNDFSISNKNARERLNSNSGDGD